VPTRKDNNKIEKTLEALQEAVIDAVGEKNAERCPAIRILRSTITNVKASNNLEVRLEVGIAFEPKAKCPCLKKN